MRSTLKPWVVALGLALAAELAPAAGFGKINVSSALGQPLAAEIDLLNVSPEDLVGMQVRLASPEAFREANVDFSPALSAVRFTIEKRPSGQSYIKVSSNQPISEPALNLLVEVTWPSGRLLRDYPVLLNPAGYAQEHVAVDAGARLPASPPEVPVKAAPASETHAAPTPPPAPAAAAKPSAPARSAAAAKPAPVPSPEGKAATKPEAAAPAPAAPGGSYTVKPGDTLRVLASNSKPGSASLEQTMLAMFEANRSAFINDSIHRIRAGKQIHLPTESEASAVTADEAGRRVNLLASDFEAYRRRVADAAEAKPASSSGAKAPVTGKLSAQTEDAARPAKPGTDVVQVSRSAAGPAKAGATANGLAQRRSAADEKANHLEEEAVARENQLKEARERVALLEGNLAQMRALLEKKGEAPAKADAAAKGDAPKMAPAPTPEASIKPPMSAPEAVKPVAPPVEAPKPAAPEKSVVSSKNLPAETSFMDDVLAQLQDNPLAIGGGVLGGLLVGWLGLNAARRRRDRTRELFAPSTTSPEPMTVDAVTTDKGSALVDTNAGSYSSDFGRVPDHQVDEVDPVAEADVYIAYGRDVQAEEILKEAMAKDPDRTEILMKLLEIYAQRKSVGEYAQHALQLRERVGISHPLWSAAMAMGFEIDPENPLYHGAGDDFVAPVAPHAAPGRLDLDLDLGEHVTGEAPAPIHLGDPLPAAQPDLSLVPAASHAADSHDLFEIGEPLLPAVGPAHGALEDAAHAGAAGASKPGSELGEDADAAETLRALSAISAESLRGAEVARTDGGPGAWPALPEVAAFGGGLALAASNEPARIPEGGDPFTLDFDLGETAAKPAAASMEHSQALHEHGNAALELGKIDLDLNKTETQPSSPPVLTLVSSPAAVQPLPGEVQKEAHTFGDIDLDLRPEPPAPVAASLPAEQSSQWHNVATKLDLARAYLEIGDKDGAREILREVSAEGDETQRQEAERLAVQI
ncbi:MAG: hypothetical protein KGI67_10390 [Pseudomonadota bacterium]|nr:hypothetical protein [Pseudomonadota bacterium]